MRHRLVIFDCDGVLVDSEALASEALRRALGDVGLSFTTKQADEKFRGKSLLDITLELETLLGHPLPGDFVPALNRSTFALFREGLRPVPEAARAVKRIQSAGLLTCVASSGTHEKMELTLGLTGLLSFFEGRLFSATQVTRGKPAPDLFLYAAREMGVDVNQATVIEDSLPGALGAKEAGARVLAYVAAEHPARQSTESAMRELGVSVFSSMGDLPDLILE